MDWDAALTEQLGQALLDILAFQAACHPDRQAFAGKLIDDIQGSKRFAVMGATHHKIVAPHMARIFSSQPHTRTVIEPQSTPFGLLFGHFETFLTPYPLYSLVIDLPARIVQQSCHPAVAVAAN